MKTILTTVLILVGFHFYGYAQDKPDMHAVGESIPGFELKDLNGKTWTMSDLEGKVVLIDFWYMACPPCKMSNPKVKKIYKKYADDGLVVLAVNAVDNTEKNRPKLKEYKEKENVEYTILLADNDVIKTFRVPAYPSFYIVGKDGKIKYAQGGYHPYVYQDMKAVIKDEL